MTDRFKIALLLLISTILPISSFGSYGTAGFRIITARSGLNIRSTPSTSGRRITTIPNRAIVKVSQKQKRMVTIRGRRGRWIKIQWKTNSGWIFDAYTVPVIRGLAGLSFRTTTTATDLITQLYIRNNRFLYYIWGGIGGMGYRVGKYTIHGNSIRVHFYREVILVNQNPPAAARAGWKKNINKILQRKKFTLNIGLVHKIEYVLQMRGEEIYQLMQQSAWKDIQTIDATQ